ncbi:MAG TPA: S4 domain-containing protein [Gemmatimonadaceae bacterium]|nr:S4 domain-containing protein [Gemmatimonadaceae bacterium]
MTDDTHPGRVRLDKWLWAARFFKTRALAADAVDGGRIEVNDERAKRARVVQVGDRIRIRRPPFEHVVEVTGVSDQRGPAAVAAGLYRESDESQRAREALAGQLRAMGPPAFRDKGRPSKKERRDIERWRTRDE